MVAGRRGFWMRPRVEIEAFWDARSMGASIVDQAAILGTAPYQLRKYVVDAGGLRPRRWKTPRRLLDFSERLLILEGLTRGDSIRTIATQLGRAPSTISREIKRGQFRQGSAAVYGAVKGERVAVQRRQRPKPFKLLQCPRLLAEVLERLERKQSPEQIMGRLRDEFPDDPGMHVSHETIYRTLYLQGRGQLKLDLKQLFRRGKTIRTPRKQPGQEQARMKIPDGVSIWERPDSALEREIPGHWEGDLIMGTKNRSAIGTIIERHSNYLLLIWLDPTKDRAAALAEGLIAKLGALPETLRLSLAWDQGNEMMQHKTIADMADIDIYFADPHAPWQRASNENTNGLLRQYFPKGTDLATFSQLDLDFVEDEMNDRPRKRLDYATPKEVLSKHLLQ